MLLYIITEKYFINIYIKASCFLINLKTNISKLLKCFYIDPSYYLEHIIEIKKLLFV